MAGGDGLSVSAGPSVHNIVTKFEGLNMGAGDACGADVIMEDLSHSLKTVPNEQQSGDYRKLIDYGLDEKVAAKLDEVYNTGKYPFVLLH